MQVKKQQLELDMEQQTGSILLAKEEESYKASHSFLPTQNKVTYFKSKEKGTANTALLPSLEPPSPEQPTETPTEATGRCYMAFNNGS